jgi:hypothetical protein
MMTPVHVRDRGYDEGPALISRFFLNRPRPLGRQTLEVLGATCFGPPASAGGLARYAESIGSSPLRSFSGIHEGMP